VSSISIDIVKADRIDSASMDRDLILIQYAFVLDISTRNISSASSSKC